MRHPVQVWVRVKRTGDDACPNAPDVPELVMPKADAKGALIPGTGFREWRLPSGYVRDLDSNAAQYGEPMLTLVPLEIEADDVAFISSYIVPIASIPAADRQLAELVESWHQGRLEADAEASFATHASDINAAKAGFERNLKQARLRGLSAAKAAKIATDYGLALTALGSVEIPQ